ncbi:MAG TPA: wax ester/triacylglycerol synthase domain-containing protein, partial [Solirubrobacteraceae bacterium]
MSPLDASFLHIEEGDNHMHIGSVTIFEGPPPPQDRVAERVERRLDRVPRYRQRVEHVPLTLG